MTAPGTIENCLHFAEKPYANGLCRKCYDFQRKSRRHELAHWRQIERNYGLTRVEWEKILEKQKGRCDICEEPLKVRMYSIGYTDHSHQTGKFRGILCSSCNIKLGWLERRRIKVDDYLDRGTKGDMNSLNEVLNDAVKDAKTFHIAETGNTFTRSIAKWIESQKIDVRFESVSLDGQFQALVHEQLETDGTAKFCTFHCQSPTKYFVDETWIDVVFLTPADIQDGLEQFCLAASCGTKIIIIGDYQTRAVSAVYKARALGWKFEQIGRMSILKRPI